MTATVKDLKALRSECGRVVYTVVQRSDARRIRFQTGLGEPPVRIRHL